MNEPNELNVTTPLKTPTISASRATAVGGTGSIRRASMTPVLFVFAITAPTTTNLQLSQQAPSLNFTYAGDSWLGRRRSSEVELEQYSAFSAVEDSEVGPLRLIVSRSVNVKVNFVGQIKMLPIHGEF
jgi:hypothetical protein